MQTIRIHHDELRSLIESKFIDVGLELVQAKKIADVLVHADLRNVQSHGALRTEHYINRMLAGGINKHPKLRFKETGPVTGVLDGDDGFGHIIADKAMEHAIQLAEKYGVGMITAYNSSHCGALSYFVEKAVHKKFIGIVMTHTDKIVVPFGGAQAFSGTNPVAFGIPTKKKRPFILDMATSTVALGKILKCKEEGKSIPIGWGVNKNGESVTDPNEVVSLTPFGGAKGFGLSLIVDVFSGILSGMTFGPHINKMYENLNKYRKLGHFFCVIDPQKFTELDRFLTKMDEMIEELHGVEAASGHDQVFLPGEIEQLHEEENVKHGVPIPETIYHYLINEKTN